MKFNEFINESHNVDIIKKLDIQKDFGIVKVVNPAFVADAWLSDNSDKNDIKNAQKYASIADMVHEVMADVIYGANVLYTAQKKLDSMVPAVREVPNDAVDRVRTAIKELDKAFRAIKDEALMDLQWACEDLNLSIHNR